MPGFVRECTSRPNPVHPRASGERKYVRDDPELLDLVLGVLFHFDPS